MSKLTFVAAYAALGLSAAHADPLEVIRNRCAAEWPGNYRMREYCQKRQYEGITYIREFLKSYGFYDEAKLREDVLKSGAASTILDNCLKEWPGDYRMAAYCLEREEEAAKRLGKLR